MKRPPRSGRIGAIERWLPFWEPQLVVACAIALQLSLSDAGDDRPDSGCSRASRASC